MDKQRFIEQAHQQLCALFSQKKFKGKTSDQERGRVEGFLHAGQYLGLISAEEGRQLMNRAYFDIFGVTLDVMTQTRERRKRALETDNDDYLNIPAVTRQAR